MSHNPATTTTLHLMSFVCLADTIHSSDLAKFLQMGVTTKRKPKHVTERKKMIERSGGEEKKKFRVKHKEKNRTTPNGNDREQRRETKGKPQ